MACDRLYTFRVDIIPKLSGCYSGILRMKLSALMIVSIPVIASEHSQIMQQGNTDNLTLIDADSGFIEHFAHCQSGSCSQDGMITDRRTMMMLLR